jgi:hypothetical protein
MTKVDSLRNEIIEKVLCISNKDYLSALNEIVNQNAFSDKIVKVTAEQRQALDSSEKDITNERTINHIDLMKSKRAWLKGK